MSEARRNEIMQQFRRPANHKSSRSRDLKTRLNHLRSKDTFLTDTQTSDYTKSSGQINAPRLEQLQDTIRKLQRQNAELKQRILQLKTSQCFEINEEKLKNVIRETDYLREQLQITRKQYQQSLVERDFLERFNKNLKTQCETLTKEILVLRANPAHNESKKLEKNIYTSREEGLSSSRSRNSSNDLGITNKRKEFQQWRKDKQQKETTHLLKGSLSASQLHEDYYGGRGSRAKPLKNH